MENELKTIQYLLAKQFLCKVDVYYQEGFGVLAVKHGDPLTAQNVIYAQVDS